MRIELGLVWNSALSRVIELALFMLFILSGSVSPFNASSSFAFALVANSNEMDLVCLKAEDNCLSISSGGMGLLFNFSFINLCDWTK